MLLRCLFVVTAAVRGTEDERRARAERIVVVVGFDGAILIVDIEDILFCCEDGETTRKLV